MTYNPGSLAYNITFEASLSDTDKDTEIFQIFQTNVRTSIALPVEKITIVFVRIKPNWLQVIFSFNPSVLSLFSPVMLLF